MKVYCAPKLSVLDDFVASRSRLNTIISYTGREYTIKLCARRSFELETKRINNIYKCSSRL